MKIKLKATVQMVVDRDYIYLRTSSQVHKISIESDSLLKFFTLLNGSYTIDEIYSALEKEYKDITKDKILEYISQLDSLYLLEYVKNNNLLSDYELGRYSRNLNFFDSFLKLDGNKYLAQKKLNDAKVVLLGLGGLGSHVLFDMAAMGIHNIRAIEFDKVEISNLNRQILYTENDIGNYKADIALKRIKEFNSKLNLEIINTKIESQEQLQELIKGYDVVVCVADRPKTLIRSWLNESCVKEGIPFITGGLDTQIARWYSYIPRISGCIECWRKNTAEIDKESDYILKKHQETELKGDNAAFVAFVSLIAGFIIAELTKIITGIAKPIGINNCIEINFNNMQTYIAETWEKRQDCEICGNV
ncbi:MAG: ThiF family adenylyltransferase [Alphaproteobacteria bacterium]|jgi:molybdopterin/thiamine biosynthesis adenylyltransferase|nr:ThiF family adenylyltransferase [Alphaproteobacteria bacterium]